MKSLKQFITEAGVDKSIKFPKIKDWRTALYAITGERDMTSDDAADYIESTDFLYDEDGKEWIELKDVIKLHKENNPVTFSLKTQGHPNGDDLEIVDLKTKIKYAGCIFSDELIEFLEENDLK